MTNPTDATEAARKFLLSSDIITKRANLVGAHAAALAAHESAKAAVISTAKDVETTYAELLKGGWTGDELAEIGYRAPSKPRGRGRGTGKPRKTRESAPKPADSHTPATAADTPVPADHDPGSE